MSPLHITGWKTLLWGGLVVVVAVVAIGVAVGYVEYPAAGYATYDQVAAAPEAERAWVPSVVPPTAREIRIVHGLDTDARWTQFVVPPAEAERLARRLEPIPLAEARRLGERPPWRVRRWPRELQRFPSAPAAAGFRTFRTADGADCVAIQLRTGSVAVWSCAPAS